MNPDVLLSVIRLVAFIWFACHFGRNAYRAQKAIFQHAPWAVAEYVLYMLFMGVLLLVVAK